MPLCDRCSHAIAGTPDDPVCHTSLGKHHFKCMRAAHQEKEQRKENRADEIHERRSAGQRKRRGTVEPESTDENTEVTAETTDDREQIVARIIEETTSYMRVGTSREGSAPDLDFDGTVETSNRTFTIKRKGEGAFEITRVA